MPDKDRRETQTVPNRRARSDRTQVVAMLGRLSIVALSLTPGVALGASFDGTYAGTLSCPAFPGQEPLRTRFVVKVAERKATYEQTSGPGAASGDLGANEGGNGSVSPAGALVLSGGCRGGFSCATEYRGDLSKAPIRLKGTQRWWFRSGDRERECDVELERQKP